MKDYVCINSFTQHFSKWPSDISITFRGILFYLLRIIAPSQKEIELSLLITLDKEEGKHVIASIIE
jgi:hypothetical protein